MKQLRILTWHIHGSYLYYLVQSPHQFFLPVKPGRPEGYGGRSGNFFWPDNVHEVPAEKVCELDFDCVLFQSHRNYLHDQNEILSEGQRKLPRIFLEHDPPRQHPTDTKHPVDDPEILIVHVTPFNDLMWDSGRTPTRVIEHGVLVPGDVSYSGDLRLGIVVVNGLRKRGRRCGYDVFQTSRKRVPLVLAGMESEELGGLGDIPHPKLPAVETRYRFFFNPIRYTSLGLAVCEAMMLGMPVVALATTEMSTVVKHGISGFTDTNVTSLIECMHELLQNHSLATRMGAAAREIANDRFSIARFVRDWNETFDAVAAGTSAFAYRADISGVA